MENKLKILTDTLYEEGVQKGHQKASEIMKQAEKDAEKIISDARAEAAAIVRKAQDDAEILRHQITSEIVLASRQAISKIKNDVANLLTSRILEKGVKEAMNDKLFVQDFLLMLLKHAGADAFNLGLQLPKAWKDEMEHFFSGSAKKYLDGGLQVQFLEEMQDSFTIRPRDGSYSLEFGEEAFTHLLSEYMRPVAKQLMFS